MGNKLQTSSNEARTSLTQSKDVSAALGCGLSEKQNYADSAKW